MTVEENKALVRRVYAEIDAGNIDAMDELVGERYVDTIRRRSRDWRRDARG
jgi:ketosteroid isomerase-like protein